MAQRASRTAAHGRRAAPAPTPTELVCGVHVCTTGRVAVVWAAVASVAAAQIGITAIVHAAVYASMDDARQAPLPASVVASLCQPSLTLVLGCGPGWGAPHTQTPTPPGPLSIAAGRVMTMRDTALTQLVERLDPGREVGGAPFQFHPPPRGAIAAFFTAVAERRDSRAWPVCVHLVGEAPGASVLTPEHAEAAIAAHVAANIVGRQRQ